MKTFPPEYLKPLVIETNEIKNILHCKIQCPCNHSLFTVYKNRLPDEELKRMAEWENIVSEFNGGYSDRDGNMILTKKNIFGKIVKELKINKNSIPNPVEIVKIKCSNCGKEFIIFDSSKHGYDAFTEKHSINADQYDFIPIKPKDGTFSEIKIKIINDLTYEEFLEDIGAKLSKEDYTNAFSYISIEANIKGKWVEVFSKETA